MARTRLPYRPIGGPPSSKGVGGWLALLVFVIGVLIPLAQLNSASMLLRYEDMLRPRYGSGWPVYVTLLLSIITIRTVICLMIVWQLLYRKVPSTPRIAVVGIWIALGLLGVMSLTVGAIFTLAPYPYDAAIKQMFGPVLICSVATAYLLRSERVANTYRGPAKESELGSVFE